MVGIYAQNSVEWIVSLIAAQSASIVIVPLYDIAGTNLRSSLTLEVARHNLRRIANRYSHATGPKSIQTLISLCKLSTVIASPSNVFTVRLITLTDFLKTP